MIRVTLSAKRALGQAQNVHSDHCAHAKRIIRVFALH